MSVRFHEIIRGASLVVFTASTLLPHPAPVACYLFLACTYRRARSKRSRFITLAHTATKSKTNFSSASALAYTSVRARSWAFEPKMRSTRGPVHLSFPSSCRCPRTRQPRLRPVPFHAHVEEVREEVICERPGAAGKYPVLCLPEVGTKDTQAADKHCHLRCRECQQLCLVNQHSSADTA